MKEVRDVLHKFYMTFEDAEGDVNRFFSEVSCEGASVPYSAYANDPVNKRRAIFRLKKIRRNTIFGEFIENVYIFHNYLTDEGKEEII